MFCELIKKHVVKIHLLFLTEALILLYWQTFAYWVHTGINNFDYRFIFVIPPLAFYIVWKRRSSFLSIPVKPSKLGIFVIIPAILLYIVGQTAYISVAQQASFFIMLPGIVLYFFGFPMLRMLSIPFLLLVFMAPFPDFFYPYLQQFFARSTIQVLHFFNYPALAEGFNIRLPENIVNVAEGCTGIRSFSSIFPLGLTIAFIHLKPRWKKVLMILFSGILPVISNLFRIVLLLILVSNGNEYFLRGNSHRLWGYIVYLGTLLIFFGFVSLLKRYRTVPQLHQQESIKDKKPLGPIFSAGFGSYQNLILVALILLLPALVHYRLLTQPQRPLSQSFKLFPLSLGKWTGYPLSENEWSPIIKGATDKLQYHYQDMKGNAITVFVAYLPIQTQGREVIFHANAIVPPGFQNAKKKLLTWEIKTNPASYILKTTSLEQNNNLHHEKLLYWYNNTNHYLQNKFIAKIIMAFDNLWKNQSNGSVFLLAFKSVSNNTRDHEKVLQNFLNLFMSEISKHLPA